jgi:hypothetical protein
MSVTRLGLHGGPRSPYGSFAGKEALSFITGATGFTWTPTAVWTAVADITGETGFTWTPSGTLVDDLAPTGRSGGGGTWAALSWYDHYKDQQSDREEERDKLKKSVADIADETDAQIARILHKQIEQEAREAELQTLENLIQSTYTERQKGLAEQYNAKVAKAYVRAAEQANFSAIEAFERELDKALEEDEFLFLAMALLQ